MERMFVDTPLAPSLLPPDADIATGIATRFDDSDFVLVLLTSNADEYEVVFVHRAYPQLEIKHRLTRAMTYLLHSGDAHALAYLRRFVEKTFTGTITKRRL